MVLRCGIYFALILLLASCASQIPPTGGPKDITPPSVTKANPENLTTHFSASKISITFSEYVELNDVTNQMFFSPALVGTPTYRLRNKTLVITLPDSLRANTTYTVNFGSAIKDIREGNIMLSYQYVFSTGAAIDSFRISGTVTNVLDGKTRPNLLVMLFHDTSDSAVAKQRPDYNARTDSSGNFVLNHIAEGTYRLFALDDQDFNLMYNQPGESIGFFDSVISIHDTIGFYKVSFFKPVPVKQSVLGASSRQPGKAVIVFAKRTEDLRIRSLDSNLMVFTEHNPSIDTVTLWVNDQKSDSLAFIIHDDDFDDTVKVRMKSSDTKIKVAAPKFQVSSISRGGKGMAELNPGDPVILDFSFLVTEMNKNRKVSLFTDSAKKAIPLEPVFFSDSITGRKRAMITFPFKTEVKYTLLIPDSFFKDFLGGYNDTTKIQVKVLTEEELGNVAMHLVFSDSLSAYPFYFELRGNDGTLLAKKSIKAGSASIEFKGLAPGNYSFKVIEDRNNNLKWDTGNYWKHQQPERIFFNGSLINIRANWDIDVTMRIDNR